MTQDDSLICANTFDGQGGARELDCSGVRSHPAGEGWLWIHLQREVGDRIPRYVEDLDAVPERAQIVQEELAARVSEQIKRNMYVLSIITAVFLPLGMITGYLGISVGGIHGAEWHWAFMGVGGVLPGIAHLQLWLFRRMRWP